MGLGRHLQKPFQCGLAPPLRLLRVYSSPVLPSASPNSFSRECFAMTKSSEARRARIAARKGSQTTTRTSSGVKVMSYDKAKAKKPWAVPALTDDMCTWIGKMTLAWSELERIFDDFLMALTAANGSPPVEEWRRNNFKRKEAI